MSDADARRFAEAAEQAKRTQAAELARQAGLTVRAGINGTVGALNRAFDSTIGATVNAAVGVVNQVVGSAIPSLPSTGETLERDLNRVLPQPETATERVVQQVAESMAGAAGVGAGASLATQASGSLVRAIGQHLAANPGLKVASAAGSAAGDALVAEAGGGPTARLAAHVVGGLVPAGLAAAAGAIASAARTGPVARPVAGAITAAATTTTVRSAKADLRAAEQAYASVEHALFSSAAGGGRASLGGSLSTLNELAKAYGVSAEFRVVGSSGYGANMSELQRALRALTRAISTAPAPGAP